VIVIRMPCSYVYLDGTVAYTATVPSGGGISVSLSDNNGLDWKPIGAVSASGAGTIDLKPHVFRRYDYRLKFACTGKGTGLDALTISNLIQHSQRPLPALDKGSNTISFSAGTQEGTISVEGGINDLCKGKNLMFSDFHPQLENMEAKGSLLMKAGTGSITFPVEAPGDITGIRMGCHYRARDAKDGFAFQASFDGGSTWKDIGKAAGPTPGSSSYIATRDVPAGKRAVLVRYSGTQVNTSAIIAYAIKVDYTEPRGGFRPVRVTYVWDEAGGEKRDVHIAKKPDETYTITCNDKPVMKSIAVELAE
jgi:hypothetical protein